MWYHLHAESFKNDANELIYKTEAQTWENKFVVTRGKRVGDRLEVLDWHVHSIIFKIGNQQGLLFSTGNSAQYSVVT